MLQTPSIRVQIEQFTFEGNQLLSKAVESGSPIAFSRAIQEFSSSYKFALLLNSKDGTEQLCAFNLGVAHVAGGDTSRGIALLQTVLDHGGWLEEKGKDSSKSYLGDIYFNLASGHEKLSDVNTAVKYYTSALFEYEEVDGRKMCETYLKIANIFNARKDFPEARRNFGLAAKLYWKLGETGNALIARTCQANAGTLDKTFSQDECVRVLNSCCKDSAELKNKSLQGKILCEIGLLYSKLGCLDRALICFEKSVRLSEKTGNLHRRALALQNAGAILNKMEYYEKSITRHSLAAQLHGALKNRNAQGQSFCNLGFAKSQLAMYEEAWEAYLHALKAFEDTDDKQGQWQCHEGLGAIQFSNGKHDKAVKHFDMALACLTIGRDDGSRNRVIRKLSHALKMAEHEVATDGTLAIENGENGEARSSTPVRTPMKNSFYSFDYPSIRQPQSTPKRPSSQKQKRRLERGRRAYSDEAGRPVQHIARGISNITQYSNPFAENSFSKADAEMNNTSSSEYDSSSEDVSSDYFSDNFSFPHHSKAKQNEKNRRDTLKRKHLRTVVQASTMPIHALTTTHDADLPSGERSASPGEKGTEKNLPQMNNSEEKIALIYRKQLAKINENVSGEEEEDLTTVSAQSSSSSSSELSDDEKPKLARQNARRGAALYVDDEASLPEGQTLQTTHLYASIMKTGQTDKGETRTPADVAHVEVPEHAAQDEQNSEPNVAPLVIPRSPANEIIEEWASDPAVGQGRSPTSSSDPPASYSVPPGSEEVPPELPLRPSLSKAKKKDKKKRTGDSRTCRIM